ncbi:MAG: hypothetical protein AAF236_02055 [Verrucomicrobiota bacterium]
MDRPESERSDLSYSEEQDEFGENMIVSRLNRRFSLLLRRFAYFPASWEDAPLAEFKRHLARLNLRGQAAILLTGVIAAIGGIIFSLRIDSSVGFFISLGIVPVAFLIQFLLGLVSSANLQFTFGAPIVLASRIVPELLSLLAIANIVYVAIWASIAAVVAFSQSLLGGLLICLIGVLGLLVSFYTFWLAAHCERLLGVRFETGGSNNVAEYLLSVVALLGRYLMALVPIGFCSAAVAVAIVAGTAGIVSLTGDVPIGLLNFSSFDEVIAIATSIGIYLAIPVIAHVVYLIKLALSELGLAFFRLVRSSERIADLSDQAMKSAIEPKE